MCGPCLPRLGSSVVHVYKILDTAHMRLSAAQTQCLVQLPDRAAHLQILLSCPARDPCIEATSNRSLSMNSVSPGCILEPYR